MKGRLETFYGATGYEWEKPPFVAIPGSSQLESVQSRPIPFTVRFFNVNTPSPHITCGTLCVQITLAGPQQVFGGSPSASTLSKKNL